MIECCCKLNMSKSTSGHKLDNIFKPGRPMIQSDQIKFRNIDISRLHHLAYADVLLNILDHKFNSSSWTASTPKQRTRETNPKPGNKYEYKVANSWKQYNSAR